MKPSKITLTPKQANVYAWGWQPQARFRDAVCGRRFGKTFLAVKELQRAARLAALWQVPLEDEIWYAAPTFKQAKRVFWRRLKRGMPRSWLAGKPNETDCSLTLKSGHVMRLVGLDAYDNLRGSGLFFVLVDEWADCPYAAWEEVLRPMLSTCRYVVDGGVRRGGHALRIGTPKGFNHAFDTFQLGQAGGARDHRSWRYTSIEGGQVPADEMALARAQMDARSFRQEYEASFENYAGRVYYGFTRTESVKDCPHDPGLPLHIGMDFNINPMSAAVLQVRPNGDIWMVDEIVLPTSNTSEMAEEIARRYGRPGFDPERPLLDHITIYPDPAGAQRHTSAQGKTDISILRERGFSVMALESHPLVRDRVNLVNAKLLSADGKRGLFVDSHCKEAISCFEKLCYVEGSSQVDKRSGFDHLLDALGYFVWTHFGVRGSERVRVEWVGR